jgi:hypothetical protein
MEELTTYKQLYEQKLNEIIELNNKINELSEHLKKYTSHKGSKIYYQKIKILFLKKIKNMLEHIKIIYLLKKLKNIVVD